GETIAQPLRGDPRKHELRHDQRQQHEQQDADDQEKGPAHRDAAQLSSARAATTAWSISVAISNSGSLRRRTVIPSASTNRNSATASGSSRSSSTPASLLAASASARCPRVRRPSSASSAAISSLRCASVS